MMITVLVLIMLVLSWPCVWRWRRFKTLDSWHILNISQNVTSPAFLVNVKHRPYSTNLVMTICLLLTQSHILVLPFLVTFAGISMSTIFSLMDTNFELCSS